MASPIKGGAARLEQAAKQKAASGKKGSAVMPKATKATKKKKKSC